MLETRLTRSDEPAFLSIFLLKYFFIISLSIVLLLLLLFLFPHIVPLSHAHIHSLCLRFCSTSIFTFITKAFEKPRFRLFLVHENVKRNNRTDEVLSFSKAMQCNEYSFEAFADQIKIAKFVNNGKDTKHESKLNGDN